MSFCQGTLRDFHLHSQTVPEGAKSSCLSIDRKAETDDSVSFALQQALKCIRFLVYFFHSFD